MEVAPEMVYNYCKNCRHCFGNKGETKPLYVHHPVHCWVDGGRGPIYVGHYSQKIKGPVKFHLDPSFVVPNECPWYLDLIMLQAQKDEKCRAQG